MLDVEARASAGDHGSRRGGSDLAAWVDERRPLVVGSSFAAAIVIGIVIGLLTAPRGSQAPTVNSSPAPVAAELMPPLSTVAWATSRQPGTAHQMNVAQEPDPVALRRALSWAVATQLQAVTRAQTPTAADVTIPDGVLYYGAVEGRDASSDEFWAVGATEVANSVTQPEDPFVWKRVGTGPWQVVAHGSGACSQVPKALFVVWKVRPASCGAGQ